MDTASGLPEQPRGEGEVLRLAVAALRKRMPPDWSLGESYEAAYGPRRADAVLRLKAPDGSEAVLIVEAKVVLDVKDVANAREQLRYLTELKSNSTGLVVARYLAKSVRERLKEAGLSYADASGNILVRVQRPALYISDRGADGDPWRGPGRPRGTLKGEPAAKVVRALLDFQGPWRIRELVDVSRASTGSVYRVIEFLEKEALVSRNSDDQLEVPDWSRLLRRWSEDYQFTRTNRVTRWIAPRGLPDFLQRVRATGEAQYAVTGSVAAAAWAAYAPARSAMIYIADVDRAAEAWDLRATDVGVNVLLAEPEYAVVFERTLKALDGLTVAAPTQVAVDLMTGPGRAPSEAEDLVEWMKRNEQSWR